MADAAAPARAARRGGAPRPSSDTESEGPLSVGCVRCAGAARARAAAADQLALLSAENDALGEQLLAAQLALAAALRGAGAQQPRAPAHLLHPPPSPPLVTEGDGAFPARVVAEAAPHGAANVVSTGAIALPGGLGTVALSGGADRSLVASAVRLPAPSPRGHAGGSSGGTCCALATALLPAPALCLAPCPMTHTRGGRVGGTVAAGLMDGRVALLRWTAAAAVRAGGSIGGGDRSGGDHADVAAAASDASPAPPPLSFEWEAPSQSLLLLPLHAKYVLRVAWSPCGRFLATASHDHSLCLLRVEQCAALDAGGAAEGPRATAAGRPSDALGPSSWLATHSVRVAKLQQCHFGGAVEALAWAWTPLSVELELAPCAWAPVSAPQQPPAAAAAVVVSGGARGEAGTAAAGGSPLRLLSPPVTLVAASRGSATLHYLTLLHTTSSSDSISGRMHDLTLLHAAPPAAAGGGAAGAEDAAVPPQPRDAMAARLGLAPGGQWLPLLPTPPEAPGSAGVLEPAAAAAATTAPHSSAPCAPPRLHLLLHRLPLSEDGGQASMFGPAAARSLGQGRLALTPVGAPSQSAAGVSCVPAPPPGRDDRRAEHAAASGDGSTGDAAGGSDATEGGRYIPVGFAICDLAMPPQPALLPGAVASAGGSGPLHGGAHPHDRARPPLLLAACGDNGVVYVFRFGTNQLAARLVGHVSGSALGAQTRIAWVPSPLGGGDSGAAASASSCFYLAATSEREFAVVVYSVASGRPVARLGVGQPLPGGWLASSAAGGALEAVGERVEEGEPGDDGAPELARGHTATIKDLAAVVDNTRAHATSGCVPRPLLLTVGFDKRLLVWE